MEHGSDQADMMDFAKETGKTLYEDLDLIERKEKIHEMVIKFSVIVSVAFNFRTDSWVKF